jgi:hypothetical protein
MLQHLTCEMRKRVFLTAQADAKSHRDLDDVILSRMIKEAWKFCAMAFGGGENSCAEKKETG